MKDYIHPYFKEGKKYKWFPIKKEKEIQIDKKNLNKTETFFHMTVIIDQ